MIEIGGRPILWHIMKIYAQHGLTEFVICLGYKGYVIKEYFANYFVHMSDVTINLRTNEMQIHNIAAEPWKVTLVDTGLDTSTGGRLKRVREHVGDERFCFTYGDGVGDVDITALVRFHEAQNVRATVTAVRPPGRFGAIELDGDRVAAFHEKPLGDGGWISGGFFVAEPSVFDLIEDDATSWELGPLSELASSKSLAAYLHAGFWHPMDTTRDRRYLEGLWSADAAPWKVWP
jgi:glucose-1-phosphate cytidylyltransferase